MAEKTKSEEKVTEAAVAKETVTEAKYSIDEILAASDTLFDYPKEVVVVAFKQAKDECITISEAKKLVNDFLNKEVK